MAEWKDKYNAFNSDKSLVWRDRFEELVKGNIPAPVSVTIDSTNVCNIACKFCHYREFRKEKQRTVSKEDLMWLADTVPKLGAISVCFAGGGEPLLHPSSGEFMMRLKDNGIGVGLITNGVFIDRFMDEILECCRFVGASVDCANSTTYKELKGGIHGEFYRVINNLRTLARKRKDSRSPSIGFKFLFHPDNYHEFLDAVKLAKSLGVDDVHGRPVYDPHVVWDKQMVEEVLKQVGDAQNLETDDFHVFGVTHKFDETFEKKVIDKCEVTPIAGLTFAADGYCYICCDLRGEDQGRLCKWRDILDVWGSKQHREVLSKLDPRKCPYRCTFNIFQEILEKVFREDRMCYRFP